MQINVRSTIRDFEKQLNDLQRKQIPYALSRALNDTAIAVQDAEVENVQKVFKNRTKWWTKGNRRTGIRVAFSSKNKLVASTYTDAYFAQLQEDGGIKKPHRKYLAIPSAGAAKNLRKSGAAKNLPRTFVNKIRHSDIYAVYQRKGKKSYPIKILYVLTDHATVKPALHFEDVGVKTVYKTFASAFHKRFSDALATAKR